jgi:hypothetical protein
MATALENVKNRLAGISLEDAQTKLQELIDIAIEVTPAEVCAYVDELRAQNPGISNDELAHKIVSRKALKNGFLGAVTSVGGMITLPVGVPADLWYTWKIQAFMACAIAYVYGHSQRTTDLRTDILLIMAGDSAKEALKRLGIEVSKGITKKTVNRLVTRELMQKIWGVVGRNVITKAGSKSATSIVRLVPLAGAPVGFLFDWLATRAVGHFAIKYYSGRG